jgi:hypothetical protein
MKKFICIMLAAAVICGGTALAQTKAEEPKAIGQPEPSGTSEQPKPMQMAPCPCMQMMQGKMTPEMQKQMQEKMGQMGMMCPMPGMDTQKLQKQIDEMRQRVDALEAQLKKKK